MKLKNEVGNRFGRLVVLDRAKNSTSNKVRYLCLCDCSNLTEVTGTKMRLGITKSCGCLRSELVRQNNITNNPSVSGSKNHNWKGGITPENVKLRGNTNYKQWRFSVFKRDDFVCKKCGQKSGILNAHHIESFNGYPELRTRISNGITLCFNCHKNFHHQYGRGDNNKKQLITFLEEK